ncbi:cyclic nucleotide-binding domain-containing protein [Ferrimonas sediminicola]|uniref:cyclic nucleotide-binding domain-containing protein n=1 Tax=Ferrimonas sediminicola TaxID=2569538 RepID=UPI003898D5BE
MCCLKTETDRLVLSPIDHYHFEPDAAIYHQGQQAPAVYSIRNGCVKLSLFSSESGERIVRLLGTGSE